MDKMSRYEVFSLVLQLFQALAGIGGTIVFKNGFFLIFLALIPITAIGFMLLNYQNIERKEYVQFIEYLIDNEKHNFRVLPLLRMYIHKNNYVNKVTIDQANIKCTIKPSSEMQNNQSDVLHGDYTLEYNFAIVNKNLPKIFHFISANDYSNDNPEIKYRFNNSGNYIVASSKPNKVNHHGGGIMKHALISFDNAPIQNKRMINLEIVVNVKRAFAFSKSDRDTIICLPCSYSSNVNQIEYTIDVSNFSDGPFYCNAKRIIHDKIKYHICDINCDATNNTVFMTRFEPDNQSENACYFRIGLAKEDPDDNN